MLKELCESLVYSLCTRVAPLCALFIIHYLSKKRTLRICGSLIPSRKKAFIFNNKNLNLNQSNPITQTQQPQNSKRNSLISNFNLLFNGNYYYKSITGHVGRLLRFQHWRGRTFPRII